MIDIKQERNGWEEGRSNIRTMAILKRICIQGHFGSDVSAFPILTHLHLNCIVPANTAAQQRRPKICTSG